jgi:hypothetical protein
VPQPGHLGRPRLRESDRRPAQRGALFRLRQAQGVLRLGQRYSDQRLEAACRRAIEAGDPSYRTVKGILAAGTETETYQAALPGIDAPAWLHGPAAFDLKGAGQ